MDTGAKVLAGSPNEKITEGLDGLRERLKEYFDLGAKFTKWRGVYNISKEYPSKLSIQSNAHALARYSALVQECNMVPIVEPEVCSADNISNIASDSAADGTSNSGNIAGFHRFCDSSNIDWDYILDSCGGFFFESA